MSRLNPRARLPSGSYDYECRRCPRLATFLDEVQSAYPTYFCHPVPPFGAAMPRLVIVGLAPGKHGANRSGRPFTGDYAGILLYQTLYDFGFGSAPTSVAADDGLELIDCRITNAVKCLPPNNKPLPIEVRTCNDYLATELRALRGKVAFLAMGRIAHEAIVRALALAPREVPFAHGAAHALHSGNKLFDSYHCSRYNTNTGRLTASMFRAVFTAIAAFLGQSARPACDHE